MSNENTYLRICMLGENTYLHIYVVSSISFQAFLYRHLKLLLTLENSVCYYCYTSYERTDQFLWFQIQMNCYCSNWNPPNEWYAIKFCFKLGKNATETYGMLQTAFWPSCINWASVFEQYQRFKEGRESLRDDERCGRCKEVNTPELIG